MSQGHTLPEFITNVLIPQTRDMLVPSGYLSFGQIAMNIEFFGACWDAHPFEKPFESKSRFRYGITHYMAKVNPEYGNHNADNAPNDLYKYLRCGMAHIVRPVGHIGLIGRGNAKEESVVHLTLDKGRLVLVAEDFYEDFEKACHILLGDLPAMPAAKLKGIYLPVG